MCVEVEEVEHSHISYMRKYTFLLISHLLYFFLLFTGELDDDYFKKYESRFTLMMMSWLHHLHAEEQTIFSSFMALKKFLLV